MAGVPVTANMFTTAQLDSWMQNAVKRTLATPYEWGYAMNALIPGSCPDLTDPNGGYWPAVFLCCGMVNYDSTTAPQITSTVFLNCLLQQQQAINAANPAPGGSGGGTGGTNSTAPVNPSPTSNTTASGSSAAASANAGTTQTPGSGVLGITNCSVCQSLANNPLLLLILVIAAYFLIFKE